jgi:hypothetical protein
VYTFSEVCFQFWERVTWITYFIGPFLERP